MATCKRSWAQLSTTLFCVLSMSCGGDSGKTSTPTAGGSGSTPSGTAGTGGSSTGSSGSGAGKVCINTDEPVNPDCAPVLQNEPSSGDCAPRGVCCHRASNKAKAATLGADDSLDIEYRLNYSLTINSNATSGNPIAVTAGIGQAKLEAQNLLWRITVPRKGGQFVSGKGKFTPGYGTYNCDGTYSLFGDTAAPNAANHGVNDDAARWNTKPVDITVDVTKTGADRYHTAFADSPQNRQLIYVPYVNTSDTAYPLDWELATMGFKLLDITEDMDHDCVGKVGGGANGWTAAGHYETFTSILGNNKSIITALAPATYCTLQSFGLGAKAGLDCEKEPRCVPGSANCAWKKLPDSYCPQTTAEQGLFNCHLGAKGNINQEMDYPSDDALKCSDDAPTMTVDPDDGATSNGQCCDPLGKSTTLPACNAHRLVLEFTAAAAEITDKNATGIQKNCSAM